MIRKVGGIVTLVCALCMVTAFAQMSEVKEKPAMYSYVAFWNIARAQWPDMDKVTAADNKILAAAISNGTVVGYGDDQNLVHQPDGFTQDTWFSAMSMGALLNTLEQFYKSGAVSAPVEANANKHADQIYVSHYYNWHSGSWKGVYTHGSSYNLKKDAPSDAVDRLSKSILVPFMEKLLADGAIHEYEIDTEAIHTQNPDTFWLFYIAANAEGLDKANTALDDLLKSNPTYGPAFTSMVDFKDHRDDLVRTNAAYK